MLALCGFVWNLEPGTSFLNKTQAAAEPFLVDLPWDGMSHSMSSYFPVSRFFLWFPSLLFLGDKAEQISKSEPQGKDGSSQSDVVLLSIADFNHSSGVWLGVLWCRLPPSSFSWSATCQPILNFD
jgi:hypothetical protein